MKTLTNLVFILFLALYIGFLCLRQSEFFFGIEYEVQVTNGFRLNSSTPLVIWCASPNKDLGGRALQEGEDFSWPLRTEFLKDTWFFCTVKYDRRRKRFDAFRVRRDGNRCLSQRKCFWMVTEEGIYFSNNEVRWQKDHSWA